MSVKTNNAKANARPECIILCNKARRNIRIDFREYINNPTQDGTFNEYDTPHKRSGQVSIGSYTGYSIIKCYKSKSSKHACNIWYNEGLLHGSHGPNFNSPDISAAHCCLYVSVVVAYNVCALM